jgi:hypothetical protein
MLGGTTCDDSVGPTGACSLQATSSSGSRMGVSLFIMDNLQNVEGGSIAVAVRDPDVTDQPQSAH